MVESNTLDDICPFCSTQLNNEARRTCYTCNTLDRNRCVLQCYESLRPLLSGFHCLNLTADEVILDRDYFLKVTNSVYLGQNHIDLQKIDLPDNSFDFTVCNHVLEHVRDDKIAIQELARVTRSAVQITVPVPTHFYRGTEYGAPDPDKYFHFRHYGADYGTRVKECVPHCEVLVAVLPDPPTGSFDTSYLVAKNRTFAENAFVHLRDAGIPCIVI